MPKHILVTKTSPHHCEDYEQIWTEPLSLNADCVSEVRFYHALGSCKAKAVITLKNKECHHVVEDVETVNVLLNRRD